MTRSGAWPFVQPAEAMGVLADNVGRAVIMGW